MTSPRSLCPVWVLATLLLAGCQTPGAARGPDPIARLVCRAADLTDLEQYRLIQQVRSGPATPREYAALRAVACDFTRPALQRRRAIIQLIDRHFSECPGQLAELVKLWAYVPYLLEFNIERLTGGIGHSSLHRGQSGFVYSCDLFAEKSGPQSFSLLLVLDQPLTSESLRDYLAGRGAVPESIAVLEFAIVCSDAERMLTRGSTARQVPK